MREPAPKTIYLKDYAPPAFLISAIDLDVDIREDHALVRAVLQIARNPKAAATVPPSTGPTNRPIRNNPPSSEIALPRIEVVTALAM